MAGLIACAAPAAAPADDAPPHRVYGPWRSSAMGGGGYLQQVVFCSSDTDRMYVAVDVGGLYRSDDGGQTWHMLHGSLPPRAGNYSVAAIAVHPDNADELVIATGSRWAASEGIYLSRDGGQTWKQTLDNARFMADGPHRADGLVLVRSPADPAVLIAGSIRNGVYRSTDGGETWSLVGLKEIYPTAIVFDVRDSSRVWLCAATRGDTTAAGGTFSVKGGLFESRDGGVTWEKVTDIAPREFVQHPANPDRLYGIFDSEQIQLSLDDGRTWTPFNEGLPPVKKPTDARDQGIFRALAAGPDFILAGASNGSIYILDAQQAQWRLIERQSVEVGGWFSPSVEPMSRRFGAAMGYIAIDPRDPNHWVFTDWYALYRTRDTGRTWDLTIDGIEATVIHAVRGSPADPMLVHLGMGDNGYFRSTDGGQTYQVVATNIGNNIKDIAVSPVNPDRVYAVGPHNYGWHANQVFISDDAGASWRRSAMKGLPDMSRHRCNTVAAGVGSADEVWLAVSGAVQPNGGGVYRSTDVGQTWAWASRGLPEGKALFRSEIWVVGREIAVGVDGTVLCASHSAGGVYRLDDAQDGTWQACASPGQGRPHDLVAGIEPGQFYLAMREGGLYGTDDHGRSWRRLYEQTVYHVAVDPRSPGRLAASTDDGVILSTDGGQSWQELDKRLPYRVARLPLCFAGNRLIVGTAGSGAFWLELDTDQKSP